MNIAVIDADLIGRKRHRFPNLVCMKLSAYLKERGNSDNVRHLRDFEAEHYDLSFYFDMK